MCPDLSVIAGPRRISSPLNREEEVRRTAAAQLGSLHQGHRDQLGIGGDGRKVVGAEFAVAGEGDGIRDDRNRGRTGDGAAGFPWLSDVVAPRLAMPR